MSLGGGNWTAQSKVLPGIYINFISAAQVPDILAERGIVAYPASMDWGPEQTVVTMTKDNFKSRANELLGDDATANSTLVFREMFRNAHTVLLYRMNTGAKATCTYCDAKYSGIAGNKISIVISANVDDETKFDVKTKFDGDLVDHQIVSTFGELVDNKFVVWKEEGTLEATTGIKLSGGTGSTADVASSEIYINAMEAFGAYSFHALCIPTTTDEIKTLVAERTKFMRDELGVKFQTVMYRNEAADYEGVVSVQNTIEEAGTFGAGALVAWVAGAIAGCAINKSNTNKEYDGELTPVCTESQLQLEDAINEGKFMFHHVGQSTRVLMDVNTLTTFTESKGVDFASNQTIRIIDQIAVDFANIFNNKYNGKIPNNESGRISLWSDFVDEHTALERVGAIENFVPADMVVEAGADKKSVVVTDLIQVVNCMEKCYVSVVVG